MEELILRQQAIADLISKVTINFKKDPRDRKTADYIKKRLETIDTLWVEYVSNHSKLCKFEDQSHSYFINELYKTTEVQYKYIRDALQAFSPSPEREDRGTPSKTDDLISQQRTNFRAMNRVVRGIDINNITEKWELEDKLQMLQNKWKTIDELHWQIDNLLIGSEIDYEQEYSQQETIYESTKRELNRKINSTVSQYQSVPQIEIPAFSGNYSQWPTFMNLYSETIHNNTTLTTTQKMQHLKGKLKGEAERLVQHLNISAENYETCWAILTHRYNNIQLLFTKQIQLLMNQPVVQKQNAFDLKRLHDTSKEAVHAIRNLGVDTRTWGPILVHILSEKLDSETLSSYMEARKAPRELAAYDEFMEFLEAKFTALEPLNKKAKTPITTNNTKQNNQGKEFSSKSLPGPSNYKHIPTKSFHATTERQCPLCKSTHVLMFCEQFQNMTPDCKIKTVKQLDICQNCLFSHNGKQCNSYKKCRVCYKPHHTSLHDMLSDTAHVTGADKSKPPSSMPPKQQQPNATAQKKANHVSGESDEVLLATVQLKVKAANGTYVHLRCLLDQGSQINLITESAAQRLGLQRRKQNATVTGIGSSSSQSNGMVQLICESLYSDFVFSTEALVMSKVLNNLPNYTFDKQNWPHLQNIRLADPDYNISRPVDVLLDAGVYTEIVMEGILRGPVNAPMAQQTKVGWVLLGNVKTFQCHAVLNDVEEISRFWEMEDISENNCTTTTEEDYCENLYKNTTRRLEDGRYEVKIPMKQDFEQHLGNSKSRAVAQFLQLEKRLRKNEELSESYKTFISEYIQLGHMKESAVYREPNCFLPHHGVIKPDSTTTKMRVVFNGASKTQSGYSLNDLMECGPNLQQDLLALILRWRGFEYVYTADIEKFYRQIYIQEEDQHLQKIVWRNSNDDDIKEFQLCTVTYGTKAAPFLAMRTIKQLIKDNGHEYPQAVDVLDKQLYVDDLLAGSNDLEQAKQAQFEVISMLQGGGFKIRKWTSNNIELLKDLSPDQISQNMLDLKHAETNKTLGITWNPCTDLFTFHQTLYSSDAAVTTKRILLSELSKLYDPLGWLSPITVKAKLLFQQLWSTELQWDDPLPENIRKEWDDFKLDLQHIRNITIQRWMGKTQEPIELHGFCDASEKAFACVIYCKSNLQEGDNKQTIRLLAAKTKLAPLKKAVSLPRLELCAALLLSKLMKKVIDTINKQTCVTVYGWTDSMVTLGWLQGEVSRWKPFVANRVTEIINTMPPACWNHVKSEDNAADCASRGLSPSQLISHPLWWEGPKWLKEKVNIKTDKQKFEISEEETKIKKVGATQTASTIIEELLNKHSSVTRVARVISWIMRFISNARNASASQRAPYLTTSEKESAYTLIVKSVQTKHFATDISDIHKQGHVHSKSKIINLNPILDKNNILRVGGRLNQSNLGDSQKHPIILPNKEKFTELLIDQAHKATLHGGARLTLSYMRYKYWVLGGMRTVKHRLLQCVRCHRFKTTRNSQLMADLPKARVTPSRPFTHTGVDFTGHVEVKANKGRGIKTTKGYIAIFICLVTKAVHLELVSDLGTTTFLAALKRLCARRGKPKIMYSDNGTNFVGAARVLDKEYKEAVQTYITTELLDKMAELGIAWQFNAPAWPTAGGLWEAAVKSMKHHLKRVLGEQKLTYEEFSTLLAQIEACLNSRPLVQITTDIDDLECLTPGHFLVGGPVLSGPLGPDLEGMSLTGRWKLTEGMHREFWKKWSSDYLTTLQTRGKWTSPTQNLQKGDMVLVRDALIPPAHWLLGRVTLTHPGSDDRVRVVTLKTKNGEMKRPITKLSRLPIDEKPTEPPTSPKQANCATKTSKSGSAVVRTKPPYKWFSTLLVLLSICVAQTTQQAFNVTPLDPMRFVYFDKITEMQVVQDEWKMVVFYNMSMYWQSLAMIEKYVDNLLTSIDREEAAFLTIKSQLQHEINELKHYNGILRTDHGTRSKRGLINGIGYVANTLFGVLDERFAQKYDKDIKLVQQNENHLLTLYKEHTSIIEGEYNLLKRNEDVMNKQFTIINNHLIEQQQQIRQGQEHNMYTISSVLAATSMTANLRRVQQSLIDMVTDVRNGRMDSHLIKPDEFQQQLNIISAQLPNDLSLPCTNNNHCIQQMYKLSRVRVRLTENLLIFELKLPLINNEQFEINQILTIPQIKDQKTIRIKPTTKYIAVNLRKDMMIPLEYNDVTSCTQLNLIQTICNVELPIYDTKVASSLCEAQIISDMNITKCRTEVSDCSDEWTQLHRADAWLFSCCQECAIRIFCPNGVTSQTLRNSGIITLSPGCILKGYNFVIHAHNNYHSEIKLDGEQTYIPQESNINSIITKSFNLTSFQPENHNEIVNGLKAKIELVKEQQHLLIENDSSHDAHHYTMYSILTIVIIMIVIWIGYRMKQRFRTAPAPAPLELVALGPRQQRRPSDDSVVNKCEHDSKNDSVVKVISDKANSPIPKSISRSKTFN